MTRLADITRLDTLGIPVWQAIRPWSRSVSVHQGKGRTPDQARISAAIEAVECACAEDWEPDETVTASIDTLAIGRMVLGYARRTLTEQDRAQPLRWAQAQRLDRRGQAFVPAEFVSLDLTRTAPDWIVRSSNGQGAGSTSEQARHKGLCELLERDAFARWVKLTPVERMRHELELETAPVAWVTEFRRFLVDQGVRLRVYALDGLIDMPVIVAELLDGRNTLRSRAYAAGSCAHPAAEQALEGAIVEAAQARLGQIAGSRDDIPLDRAADLPNFLGFAVPRPGTVQGRNFLRLVATSSHLVGRCSEEIDAELQALGLPASAMVAFPSPKPEVHVVKMINPGLTGQGMFRNAA